MAGPDGADGRAGVDWRRAARIAGGFVAGTLLVWFWHEQSEAVSAVLAIAVGIALGVIVFSLRFRR